MNDILNIGRGSLLSLVLAVVLAGAAAAPGLGDALPPSVVIGVWSGPETVEQMEQGSLTNLRSGLDVAAGWRYFFDRGGYVSISSDIAAVLTGRSVFDDRETVFLETMVPLAGSTLEASAGISTSFVSTEESSVFASPSWDLGWSVPLVPSRLRFKIEYGGYQLHAPSASWDHVAQDVNVALRLDPSLRWGAELGVRGGREQWSEWFLLASDGNLMASTREDWIVAVQLQTDGMLGYFADWELSGSFGSRSSSANLYYASLDMYVPDSEGRLFASAGSALSWSPHQSLALGSSLRADFAWYRDLYAIDKEGLLTQELLHRTDLGLSVRADWTPNHRVFFVVESDGGYSLSNSAGIGGWFIRTTAGVDLSF